MKYERMMIHVADHRPMLDRVLAYYGLSPGTLVLAPDISQWCRTAGLSEEDADWMAQCFCNRDKGECRIVMCESYSQREFDNLNFAMEFEGFFDEIRKLSSLKINLLRLLLREIACHTLGTTEQGARDSWAFVELAKHEI